MLIQLAHPTDPRFLLLMSLPKYVTPDDLASRKFGKPLLFAAEEPVAVYEQPGGPGTAWIRPEREETTDGE